MLSLPESLAPASHLTQRQLQALRLYVRVVSGELKLKDAAALVSEGRVRGRPGTPLSVGSYWRTVDQARENVRESIATVLIAIMIGVVKPDEVRKLVELIPRGDLQLPSEDQERLLKVVGALLDRIVS